MNNASAGLFGSPEADVLVPYGSAPYLGLLALLLFARGADLFSTWVATPTLELEANPIARALGWRGGIVVNFLAAVAIAALPLAAISIATTSLLVASRNLQAAWLVRAVGEHAYRDWIAARYRETPPGVFLLLLLLHTGFIAFIGGGLMLFSRWNLIPFAVGFGIVVYAVAVGLFTGLSMARAAKRHRQRLEFESSFLPDEPP